MEKIIKFSKFNEGQTYNELSKEERHVKSKEWYVKKLKSMGEDEEKLKSMSLPDLGKLHAKLKNKK